MRFQRVVENVHELRHAALQPVRTGDFQHPRREHRREREADEQRHGDGEGHREPEAAHEAPDHAAEKRDRHKHGEQRERGGHDREADLARAVEGGVVRGLLLLLEVPEDVFDHDDGVINDDAHGERERHEADHVQREIRDPHDAEGGDDGRGNRQRGDERGAAIAEEKQHDERGEDRAEDEVLLHRADAGADDERVVAHDFDLVAGGQPRTELGEPLLDRVHDGDGVFAGLFADGKDDGRHAIAARAALLILLAVLHARHVAEPHESALMLAHDEARKPLDGQHAAFHAQSRFPRHALHDARGDLHILPLERLLHVGRGEAEGAQPHRIEPRH